MNAQLQAEYNELYESMARAEQNYRTNRTPENWEVYLAADKAFMPVMVRMSQAMMQAQIDAMGAETFKSFRQMTD